MISSPPEQAEHIRGKTLTPESPKPLYYPSPANVPILEQQMDPMFHDNVLSVGTPASFQSYPQPTQTPSAQSASSYYAEQQGPPTHQNSAAPPSGAVGPANGDYSQLSAYGNGQGGAQQQDNSSSIHNYMSQTQAQPQSSSDGQSAPAQDSRSAYPTPYDPNVYAAQYNQAQNAPPGFPYQPQASAGGGGVDIQAILDQLPPATNNGPSSQYAAPSVSARATPAPSQTPISSMPVAANLPARPPAQEKPATHPNYNPNDDIRSYHPHSQKPSNSQYRGTGHLQLNTRSGAGNAAPDNYSATRSNQSPSTPGYGRHPSLSERSLSPDDENSRWPPEINKQYEEFLEDERKYVLDGQWDQFPMGSRLFIGNLPTEKVTKRDVFHRFYRHGKLAQISIKQAYGFVQFLDARMCRRALQMEQGQSIRGRKMHLEVSKPQRNTKKIEGRDNDKASVRRRSRSPDHGRGGPGFGGRNVDRYSSGSNAMSPKDRDNRRFRDDYRSNRSPSPPDRGMRGRDRSRDRYDGRRRSRSRSPRRYRSPSPRRDVDDDLPLPYREPDQVPDVQVIVIDQGLPRDFIHFVEDSIRNLGLRVDVLIMSPRLNEAAVVRRQILEGVLAIVKLNTAALVKGKINLQSFDRRAGPGNVRFDEYSDLDPSTAGALVLRNKQSLTQPVQPPAPAQYGQSYGFPPAAPPAYANPSPTAHQFPAAPPSNPAPPNLSNLISSLDSNGLAQLLGVMAQSNPSQLAQLPQSALTPELARLLSSTAAQAPPPAFPPNPYPPQQPQQQQQQHSQSYQQGYQQPQQNTFSSADLAALLSGHSASQTPAQPSGPPALPTQNPPQSSSTGQPDMNEIMAQLAKYQR